MAILICYTKNVPYSDMAMENRIWLKFYGNNIQVMLQFILRNENNCQSKII